MLKYDSRLKSMSRNLRSDMTDAEQALWNALRRKQVLGVQFYRQKPIGPFIVDFYGPAAGLVVEADGGQHFEKDAQDYDNRRTEYLKSQVLSVLRFTNLEILNNLDAVMDVIFREVERGLAENKIPPNPPFSKGGI